MILLLLCGWVLGKNVLLQSRPIMPLILRAFFGFQFIRPDLEDFRSACRGFGLVISPANRISFIADFYASTLASSSG